MHSPRVASLAAFAVDRRSAVVRPSRLVASHRVARPVTLDSMRQRAAYTSAFHDVTKWCQLRRLKQNDTVRKSM